MSEYIEREAAKNILRQHQHRFTCADEANGYGTVKWSEDVIYLSEAVNGIAAIPAADVRSVVWGKWVYNDGDNIPYCSECMMPQDGECNFCPKCGADMRAEPPKEE